MRVWQDIAAPRAAETDRTVPRTTEPSRTASARATLPALTGSLAGRRVAIARDAAFAFLYPANLACLERLGAALSYFSPLAGEPVPADAAAVFLPGGYPELYAETLSCAVRFHDSIRAAHGAGVAILAECGGMMVLADSLGDTQGRQWPMAGLLAGSTHMQPRLAGLGLQAWKTRCGELRGHTFHYSLFTTPLTGVARTSAHPGGTPGETVYRLGALTASYFHAYFDSCPQAVAALLQGFAP